MRAHHLLCALAALSAGADAAAADEPSGFALKPVEGGGYAIEPNQSAVAAGPPHGLATVVDLIALLKSEAAAPEKVDFTAGKKLDGVYTLIVGRDDGTLGKYERVSDVVIFAAPTSLTVTGDLMTLSGAVVFAMKIDNPGAPSAVQRLETGAITLKRARKSL